MLINRFDVWTVYTHFYKRSYITNTCWKNYLHKVHSKHNLWQEVYNNTTCATPSMRPHHLRLSLGESKRSTSLVPLDREEFCGFGVSRWFGLFPRMLWVKTEANPEESSNLSEDELLWWNSADLHAGAWEIWEIIRRQVDMAWTPQTDTRWWMSPAWRWKSLRRHGTDTGSEGIGWHTASTGLMVLIGPSACNSASLCSLAICSSPKQCLLDFSMLCVVSMRV